MALINCKECGKEISDKATTCPNCGNPNTLTKEEKQTKLYQKWWFWVCIVLLALIVSFVIIMLIDFYFSTNGINEVAQAIQEIDNEATIYTSAGNNTIVVEIPNGNEINGKQAENIGYTIKKYVDNGTLSNYSKFIVIIKTTLSDKINIYTSTYELSNMSCIENNSYINTNDIVETFYNNLNK